MRWFLFKVFGTRVVAVYGAVSMLSVAVLAALYLTSGYAIERYVTDQLTRIPWDVSVLQRGEAHRFGELQRQFRGVPRVRSVEALGLLRLRNMSPLRLEINDRDLPVRWVAFVAATRTQLLPPELRKARAPVRLQSVSFGATDAAPPSAPAEYQVGLIAAQGEMRGATPASTVRIDVGDTLRLALIGAADDHGDDHHHAAPHVPIGAGETVFQASISLPPVQLERQEFNKWILRDVGSLSYLPEEAVLISIPIDEFQRLAAVFGKLFLSSEGIHGGEAPPPYVPEVSHLIALDRAAWVSPWELQDSLGRVRPLVQESFDAAQWLTPFSYVASDLQTMLERMSAISRLVGLVTLLIAVPLLWLGWVLAKTLSGLLVLNERRLIGLALIRGIPIEAIGRSIVLALVIAGLGGGILGLLIGTGLPIAAYSAAGHPTPPAAVLVRGVAYFAVFLGLGVLLSVLSGWSILRFVRTMTPREAMARVAGAEVETFSARTSPAYVAGAVVCLVLGGYKVVSWVAGYSLFMRAFGTRMPERAVPALFIGESVLNFVAVPLFLFGVAGLLLWRVGWIQRGLSTAAIPFVGELHWFVGQHLALGRHRVVNMLFVAGLALALTLLPQVAADSFYGRVLRGVRTSVGGDLHLEFSMADLAPGEGKPAAIAEQRHQLERPLSSIRQALERDPRVASVASMSQFVVPGVYIPGQSGLMLALVDAPSQYMRTVYYEDGLGLTQSFPSIIGRLPEPRVAVSQGLLRVRKIPLGRPIVLGYQADDTPIPVRFDDIVSFLPGQPALGVAQREGYVTAEVDYLNYLLGSDARIIAASDVAASGAFGTLRVLPSRAVFIVRTRDGRANDRVAQEIARALPYAPQQMRWEALESQRVSKDMFISLALENMSVFMIGGLVLALASVTAIGLANFVAERRTFALLRLRGLPRPMLLRISVSMFMVPVAIGILAGTALGSVSGYGISQAVWDLPRVYGVAGFLRNRLIMSPTAWAIVVGFAVCLSILALAFGLWPMRKTAREAIGER